MQIPTFICYSLDVFWKTLSPSSSILLVSVWDWKDGRLDANFEDARSLASNSWRLEPVCYFTFLCFWQITHYVHVYIQKSKKKDHNSVCFHVIASYE